MLTFYEWIHDMVELGDNVDATLAANVYLSIDDWLF